MNELGGSVIYTFVNWIFSGITYLQSRNHIFAAYIKFYFLEDTKFNGSVMQLEHRYAYKCDDFLQKTSSELPLDNSAT